MLVGDLVGRSTQIAKLSRAVQQAVKGRAQVVLLSGESGSGKTALLDLAATMVPSDAVLLRAAGHAAESDLPYAALHQLLAPVHDLLQPTPEPHRSRLLRALAYEDGDPGDAMAIAHSLLQFITRQAADRPVVILVDDAELIDPSSRQALIFVSRRLDADAVFLCLTTVDQREAAAIGIGSTIQVGALNQTAARELLRRQAPDISATVANRVLAAAAGLPLALIEITAELTPRQRRAIDPLPRRLPLGRTLESLFQRRLAAIGATERRALLLASLDDLTPGQLADVLSRADLSLADLEDAEHARLVCLDDGRCVFTHSTTRVAVQNQATNEELRRAHLLLATVLADDPVRHALHLHNGSPAGDPACERALTRAAEHACGRGGFHEAASLWEAAASHTTCGDAVRRYWAAAVDCYLRSGAGSRPLVLLDRLVASSHDEVDRAHWNTLRVITSTWSKGAPPARSQELATQAGDLLGSRTGHQAGIHLLIALASSYLVWGDYRQGKRLVDRIRCSSAARGIPIKHALVADCLDVMTGTPGTGQVLRSDWLDTLSLDEVTDLSAPLGFSGATLAWMDETAAVRRIAERQLAAMVGRDNIIALRTSLGGLLGSISEREGEWARAELEFAAAQQTSIDSDFTAPFPFLALRHAYLLAARGHVEQSAELRRKASRHPLHHSPSFRHLHACVEGMEQLTIARYREAAEVLAAAGRIEVEMGSVISGYTSRFVDWFEAMWRLGAVDEALPQLADFEAAAAAIGHPTYLATAARCRAILAAGPDLDTAFTRSMTLHAASPSVFEKARTHLHWGQRLRRERRKSDACRQLTAAHELFERLGAEPWAAMARSELAACGRRRTTSPAAQGGPLATLTPREFEVAQAVASGLSNAAAAERLFISLRTVEYHLSNAYRKLGVGDRRGLAAYFDH